METALYYTLSTISQTLAGALGMLAAFLALRVSSLDATVRTALTELDQRAPGGPAVEARPASGSVRETLSAWRRRFGDPLGGGYLITVLQQAEHLHQARETLLREARGALVVSACVMAICFVGLACTPWLGGDPWRAVPAFTMTIVAGAGCLLWYGRLVVRAFD